LRWYPADAVVLASTCSRSREVIHLGKFSKPLVALFVMVSTLGVASSAFATTTPVNQVGFQLDGAKDDILDFVTTWGIPVLFGVLIVGIAIRLGQKYGSRAANKL
jgi:membrane protein DedA with SNARE-associated domain